MSAETESSSFLEALGAAVPPEERLIVCGFNGDPDKTDVHAWRPRPWGVGREFPLGPQANAYCTVSSFRQAGDGTWRRRGEFFAAGQALMVDDVGTKVHKDVIEPLRPTALVETSPQNFQAWYMLTEPLRDRGRFDAIIRAFIANKLCGADPGMAGVTRVGRVPGFVNGKKKYLTEEGWPWVVRLRELDAARRYTHEQLIEAFGLRLVGTTERQHRLVPNEASTRIAAFVAHHKWLAQHDMLKNTEPDASGWMQMHCPWVDGHTNAADNGAAIREPDAENGYYGAFRCHHGTCANRGWAELTDWILETTASEMERNNAAA